MIERKEQHPARNRESRQTTTTAESGGGGLVSVFAPPYGEDAPPAFHRYENAKTWTRERGAKPQRRPPYGRSGARVLPAPCTIKRHLPPFSGVFGVLLAAFWTYSGKEPKNTGAAETARRVCQLTNTKRPALFLLWRHTRRVFDMDETGAGRLRTFWYRFSYQKVNQTCTTWLQILYQIRRTEEGKARRAAFLVV